MRQAQFERESFGALPLAGDRRVGRATAHREIVTGENDRASADFGGAEHEVRRGERAQLAIGVVVGDTCQRADLVKAAGIADRGDPLANRQLAEFVLARDLVRAAHRVRQRLAAAQLFDLVSPTHRRLCHG